MTSVEPPEHSKFFKDGCRLSSAHLSSAYQSSARYLLSSFSGKAAEGLSNTPQCLELHFVPHSTQEKKMSVIPGDCKSSGTQALPTTDRDSGQVSPSLEDSASPCDTKPHKEPYLWDCGDKCPQHRPACNVAEPLHSQPSRGPGPTARWEWGRCLPLSHWARGAPGRPRQLGLQVSWAGTAAFRHTAASQIT